MNQIYYTSKDGGLAGDGNYYYGKGGYGRWANFQTNTTSHGSAGSSGVVIITEFGAF